MKEYLELLDDVLNNGVKKKDRTGVGIVSAFGRSYRINLKDGFPLLTTKKVYFKTIIKELLWFISGSTNVNDLDANIWNEWSIEDGSLGPIYGKQWTAWENKDGTIINQIDYVIDLIKNNPTSKRILFHGWNVADLPNEKLSPQENVKLGKMAMPPCHLLYQFNVTNNKLSLMCTIRSNDLFLGHPFNIAQAALWVHILAQQCNLDVGDLIISIGDAHIYTNHIDKVKIQLKRKPLHLSNLKIKRKPCSIYEYHEDDFELVGYESYPAINAQIAI